MVNEASKLQLRIRILDEHFLALFDDAIYLFILYEKLLSKTCNVGPSV